MSHLNVFTLASSSKGNAVWIKNGSDEILIDAGISMKRICTALSSLGSDLSNIKAIFVTHEHLDHVSALPVISKKYGIPIHIAERSGHELLSCVKYAPVQPNMVMHTPVFSEQVGSLSVTSFVTPHDSVCSVGFVVRTEEHSMALATDMGHITNDVENSLLGVENVILESNHDRNMLLCGSYPYELKRRILSDSGHLSNDDAAAFCGKLAASGTKRILLAHLSPENNLPEIALACSAEAVDGTETSVAVASMSMPTELV